MTIIADLRAANTALTTKAANEIERLHRVIKKWREADPAMSIYEMPQAWAGERRDGRDAVNMPPALPYRDHTKPDPTCRLGR